MITCIREVRRAKGLTLQDVADACVPPTTAQTIGRLETGTRTVSVDWLNRIAAALGVTASDLVTLPARADLPLVATLSAAGAAAPRRVATLPVPQPAPGQVAILVHADIGDYRCGDEIWCDRIAPDAFAAALDRDLLVPQGAGRLLFGRLIDRGEGEIVVLPPGHGARRQALADPPWAAVAVRLVRSL